MNFGVVQGGFWSKSVSHFGGVFAQTTTSPPARRTQTIKPGQDPIDFEQIREAYPVPWSRRYQPLDIINIVPAGAETVDESIDGWYVN